MLFRLIHGITLSILMIFFMQGAIPAAPAANSEMPATKVEQPAKKKADVKKTDQDKGKKTPKKAPQNKEKKGKDADPKNKKNITAEKKKVVEETSSETENSSTEDVEDTEKVDTLENSAEEKSSSEDEKETPKEADAEKKTASEKTSEKEPEEKKYETTTLKAEKFAIQTEVDSVIWPKNMTLIKVSPKEFTTLKVKTAVEHGEKVRKGDVLVSFDLKEYERQLKNATTEMEIAKVNAQRAKKEYQANKKLLQIESTIVKRMRTETLEDALFTEKKELPMQLKGVHLTLSGIKFEMEYQIEELRQLEKMYKNDDLVEETEEIILLRQRRAVEAAKFQMEKANMMYERMEKYELPRLKTSMKEDLQRALINGEKAVASNEVELALLELNYQQMQSNYERQLEQFQKLQADRAILEGCVAPHDGQVFYGCFENGSWTGASNVKEMLKPDHNLHTDNYFLTILDPNQLELALNASEDKFSQLRVNQLGYFIPRADSDMELSACITDVDIFPSGSDDYAVTASLDYKGKTGDLTLYPGMKGKLVVQTYKKNSAITVNKSALGRDDDMRRYVYTLKDGKPQKCYVKTGRSSDGKVEICDGLAAGDQVINDYSKVETE